ncbi:MAG: hypothetical protein U1E91_02370 [Moraxella sp.]
MKTICFAILSLSLISTAEACLPSSPADVLVGRIASIDKGGELQRISQSPVGFTLKFTNIIGRFALGSNGGYYRLLIALKGLFR